MLENTRNFCNFILYSFPMTSKLSPILSESLKKNHLKNKPKMSVAQTKKWAASHIHGMIPGSLVSWTIEPHKVTFPTGLKGIYGEFTVVTSSPVQIQKYFVTVDPFTASAKPTV